MSNPNNKNLKPGSTVDQARTLGKVYVWELPIRVFHWVNVLSIVLLMLTGIYIGNPFVGSSIPEEAYYSNVMGWVRYIHFFAAFLFTANIIFRLYWAFKGNKYTRSNPFKAQFWKDVWQTIKYYLFLPNKKQHTVGHNKLAELSYLIFIGIGSVIMILTGYYLFFEPQFESTIGGMFNRVGTLFGADSFTIRSFHHLVAWGFVLFVIVHLYMVFREDWLSRNGTTSSIITGYKTEKVDDNGDKGHKSEGGKSA
ncbi:Ni/Fe-hydrogenase, b-type cytochrome subunit [Bacillus massilinigeriensis]|uniref:Ni/Fe-hydrogenase, b-type cytochrome subunit n=1 Tax=Bacillus massilionigeriensis TaxID=1805475 RepID=UPI00096B2EAF|nr:Ni/Fe-hydrogenase, b-type cytochrome subunit [Bacillus massilionigeriensis]